MYEKRQNKEKVNRTIDSNGRGSIAQFFKVRLKAKTEILTTNEKVHQGVGENGSKEGILEKIGKRNETKWIASLPNAKGGREMGVCAEPHALAAALDDVKENEQITSIFQYPAIAQKDERVGGTFYEKDEAVLGCNTCQQWAPDIGKDKSENPVSVKLSGS